MELDANRIDASRDYWTSHNVTLHHQFNDVADSLAFLRYRNQQYFNYAELMPTHGQDGKVILDFGCGPGHDLVAFGVQSRPARLIGIDVSSSSLAEARHRLGLHGIEAELLELDAQTGKIPLPDKSVDLVHSSGVLHHMAHPEIAIEELRRVIKDDGIFQAMVYNRQSLWYHLYVPYVLQVEQGRFVGLTASDAFRMSTDGPECPVSRNYSEIEFTDLGKRCGFDLEHFAAAVSCWEMSLLPKRFNAIMYQDIAEEHRDFLFNLDFDKRGLPIHNGSYVGIDGCYRFKPDVSRPRKSMLSKMFGRWSS